MSVADNQVFLIMGISEENEEASVAIVEGANLEDAKQVFLKKFPGSVPMTWPSLAEIKLSVAAMEAARDGKPLPKEFADDVIVLKSDKTGSKKSGKDLKF